MNEDIQRFEQGARYSQAVIHAGVIYLCGQVGDPDVSIAEQTRTALEKIDRLLAAHQSDKTRILQVTIWVSDISHLDEMSAEYETWIGTGHMPARATVEAKLVPGYDVEIMLTAAVRN